MTAERLRCNVCPAESFCSLSLIGIACNCHLDNNYQPFVVGYMEIHDSSETVLYMWSFLRYGNVKVNNGALLVA